MKLLPVTTAIRRVNEIDFALDEKRFEDAARLTKELLHGLEFYEEAAPQTLAPGKSAKRPKRRKRRRSA